MFISRTTTPKTPTPLTPATLQTVTNATNGMKARFRTNESLALKPRIEASYAVFKEYVKDLPKDQKAASKQEFIKEMSTLLGIDSAPILALLQKKNEVSGPCVEAMVTAKNAQQALPAELKPSAINVAADAKDLTPPIGVSAQGKIPVYPVTTSASPGAVLPKGKQTADEAPSAGKKTRSTPPLSISTAGQNQRRVVKQDEAKLQTDTDMDQLVIAERPGTTGPLGNAADTATPQKNLLFAITGEPKNRKNSFDSIG